MADFQNKIGVLGNAGARVVALSVDPEPDARRIKSMIGISYDVGYGLDAFEMERTIGCYINREPPFMHATAFLLRPDGTIHVAVYSSAQVGRLLGSDAVGIIDFVKRQESDADE